MNPAAYSEYYTAQLARGQHYQDYVVTEPAKKPADLPTEETMPDNSADIDEGHDDEGEGGPLEE